MNKEKNITFFRLATTAALFVSSASSCVEPTKKENLIPTSVSESFGSGNMSGVDFPITSYISGCEYYPTYTEEALKIIFEEREEMGLKPLKIGVYSDDKKPEEKGYSNLDLPVPHCGAPEVRDYVLIGWFSPGSEVFPVYEEVNP